uniref:Uncharacterized protein n=1 Tax=Meloidogyne enterolobii TaxID=390850 RepID=A0A6V7Y5E9_MELEN|nr:unnamed protein product [Meloidogyne enterolobii]
MNGIFDNLNEWIEELGRDVSVISDVHNLHLLKDYWNKNICYAFDTVKILYSGDIKLNNYETLNYRSVLYKIYVSASTNVGLYLYLLKDLFLTNLFKINDLLNLRHSVEEINQNSGVFYKLMTGINGIGGDDLASGVNSLSTSNVMEGFEHILLSKPVFDDNIISGLFYTYYKYNK